MNRKRIPTLVHRQTRRIAYGLCRSTNDWQRMRARAFFIAAILTLLSISSATLADGDLEDYEFETADLLLRIAAANHNSGVHKSAKHLAALFNWQQMPAALEDGQQQRAITVATSGAEASVVDLIEGRAELAIVRADVADTLYKTAKGDSSSLKDSLRLIATHKPQFLHIIVRSDYEGTDLLSLDGKRVNVGRSLKQSRRGIPDLLKAVGCDVSSMTLFHAPPAEALRRLNEGALDAVVFFDQAPSKLVGQGINDLEYRMLAYPTPDLASFGDTPAPATNYFAVSSSADFYNQPETVPSIVTATYLLTRNDVPSSAIEPIVQLLSVQPQLPEQLNTDTTGQANDATSQLAEDKPQTKPLLRALSISNSLSPIPLHPSSQLLIDIFADLPVSDSNTRPNQAKQQQAEVGDQ